MTSETRPSLLSRMRDPGDQLAWQQFDAQYHELILRYCTRRGLQLSDAEDVRQSVMLSLHRGLPQFRYSRNRGRFRDYLGRAVRHAIIELYRRQRPELSGAELRDSEVAEDPALETLWEREWVLHHYRRAMAVIRTQSDPRGVEIFERLLQGQSVPRITEEMALGRNTVYKTKQRLRERLRQQIELQIEEEQLPQPQAGSRPTAWTP